MWGVCFKSDDFTRTERSLLSRDSFWMSSLSVSQNWTTKCFLSWFNIAESLRAPSHAKHGWLQLKMTKQTQALNQPVCWSWGLFWIMFANVEQEWQCCAYWTVYTFIYVLKQQHFTCLSTQHLLSSSLQVKVPQHNGFSCFKAAKKEAVKVVLFTVPFWLILL